MDRSARDEARSRDQREYLQEWKHWLGGLIIFGAIYLFHGIRTGSWGWWLLWVPMGIWAVVLVVTPLLTRPSRD